MTLTQSWIFLLGSILCEVTGTSIMKFSQEHWPVAGMFLMFGFIGVSYFLLAKAVVRLPIGVAYSFWEGLGLLLIFLVSVFALGESINAMRLLGLGLIIGGILLVHQGTEDGHTDSATGKSHRSAHRQTQAPAVSSKVPAKTVGGAS